MADSCELDEPIQSLSIRSWTLPRTRHNEPFPLLALPLEVLQHVHAFALNPALLTVNQYTWRVLASPAARLEFALAALDTQYHAGLSPEPLAKVQNWLLNRPYLSLEFVDTVDAAFRRRTNLQQRTLVPGDSLPNGRLCYERQIEDRSPAIKATLVQGAWFPTQLLEGRWTTGRMDMMERLHRWGAQVPSMKPIHGHVRNVLMKTAVLEGDNLRAVRLCVDILGNRLVNLTWGLAIRNRCSKEILTFLVTRKDERGQRYVNLNVMSLLAVAVNWDREEPNGLAAWLMEVIETDAKSLGPAAAPS